MANKNVILIIDDEVEIRKLLRASMPEGFDGLEAETGKEGIRLTATNNPQLVLLDLGLPDMDGVEVTRRIREFSKIPIIVLSAREQEGDKVAALDAGANDYLTKPFGMAELHARMRVALRSRESGTPLPLYSFGKVQVRVDSREVTKDGALVHLTPIEFQLLLYFLQHPDKVLTQRLLLEQVWGAAYVRQPQYLRVFMGHLRHKLEDDPARPRYFITETGVGYRFRSSDLAALREEP